jgi:hypothetical protein
VIKAFEYLGDNVAEKWVRGGSREEDFGEIATNGLAESGILTSIAPEEIVAWVMKSEHVLDQKVSDFGQPPVRVYTGDGFYIEALFWIDGTTSIHEHAFTGAFGVLSGSSVQSTYTFTPERVVSERLIIGRTRFIASELLNRGSIRPIHSGDSLIHSLFHLDRPSVSIVVRSSAKVRNARPQYFYFRPYLALYDFDLPSVWVIQTRMLESLTRTDAPSFWKAAREISSHCDPFMLFRTISIGFRRKKEDQDNWELLLSTIPRQTRWLLDYILPCVEENERSGRISSLRSKIHDPMHRFFLALLLNVPTREELLRLISERFPSRDPRSLILSWLTELFKEQRAGVQLNSEMLFLVQHILQGSDFDSAWPSLRLAFGCEGQLDEELMRRTWSHLQGIDLFKPLFSPTTHGN